MRQVISYEDFENELDRIHKQMGDYLASAWPIKRVVGHMFVEQWIRDLQALYKETQRETDVPKMQE